MPTLALYLQLLLLTFGQFAGATPRDIYSSTQKILNVVPPAHLQQRKLNGRFLHITDLHPDEFYKPHSSTDEGIACHRKSGHAGAYGAEMTDCDSPMSLVDATFDWISTNLKDEIDFVVWTGDTARHDSDERHPRTTPQVLRMNKIVADKFAQTLSDDKGRLQIPIIPTFGNNDFLPHNIFFPGPNKWLRSYADIWGRFIPEAQRHSFEFGGWFWVEVIPDHLAVFSLNTMFFFDRNAGVNGCAEPSEPGFQHMEWLRVQLQLMRERGMKAILIGHVPPARTANKQNWDETCWQKYTLWLKQYRDVVTASLYGHMNIDHFLLQDHKDLDIGAETETQQHTRGVVSEEEVSVQGKSDYLQDLRKAWSNLPGSALKILETDDEEDYDNVGLSEVEQEKKKKKKGKGLKKIGGKYAERYQLTLVSPSVVPNYLPTLRVYDYNITGLEDSPVWSDSFHMEESSSGVVDPESWNDLDLELKRNLVQAAPGKNNKGKKKKKKEKNKQKYPHLTIPEDPPKGSTPGPAYYLQPLTLTGYTQYFANLTQINNNNDDDAATETLPVEKTKSSKWRNGDRPPSKQPNTKPKPKPREFAYEIEYNTFDDQVYKLKDLTVRSFLKLAYHIGREEGGGSKSLWSSDVDDQDDDDDDDDGDEEEEEDVSPSTRQSTTNAGKGKKGKKRRSKNKTWLTFLSRAFVGTVSKKDLKKM